MNIQSHRTVGVFTKSPESPDIKRRLSAQIGIKKARTCYLELLSNTLQCARHFDTTVYVTGPVENSDWLYGLSMKPQAEGDLGQRMHACFDDGVTVLFGGDSPLMSVAYIESALQALETHDLVLGPTEDGGYLLIGMNSPHHELFQAIPWSTSEVARCTLRIAEQLNLNTKCLDVVWDVDSELDYERWLDLRTAASSMD